MVNCFPLGHDILYSGTWGNAPSPEGADTICLILRTGNDLRHIPAGAFSCLPDNVSQALRCTECP